MEKPKNKDQMIKTLITTPSDLRMTAKITPEEFGIYQKYLKQGMESSQAAIKMRKEVPLKD